MMSIATDDCNQDSAPSSRTCSMTCHTTWTAAPEYRCSYTTSGSIPAAAS